MLKKKAVFLSLLFLVSSCSLVPQQGVPLGEFVHNLSKDLDCLTYCARKNLSEASGQTKNAPGAAFFVKKPFEVELSVNKEGRLSASPSPNIFSLAGLSVSGSESQAGSLKLKLFPINFCKELKVTFKPQETESQTLKKACQTFKKAFWFLDVIGGQEYLYVQGQTGDEGTAEVINRISLKEVKAIVCTPYASGSRPQGCTCPEEKGGPNNGKGH